MIFFGGERDGRRLLAVIEHRYKEETERGRNPKLRCGGGRSMVRVGQEFL